MLKTSQLDVLNVHINDIFYRYIYQAKIFEVSIYLETYIDMLN
jgi:hypothetical protein